MNGTSGRSLIRALPANGGGRDFVVGDLHGCFDLLERLLNHVRFDTACDRLFCVGDLIDRGPYSWMCLQLLQEPWCYSILGNHEIMLLDFFADYLRERRLENCQDQGRYDFLANGGAWVKAHYLDDRNCMQAEFDDCLELVVNLPLIWVVGEGEHRFQVIHGELVRPDYRLKGPFVWLDEDIDRWRCADETIPENTQERLSWGRTLMMSAGVSRHIASMQPGLSTTYCGHTVAPAVRRLLSHVCLDTGAYRSLEVRRSQAGQYGLTLHGIQEQRQVRVSYGHRKVLESDCLAEPPSRHCALW